MPLGEIVSIAVLVVEVVIILAALLVLPAGRRPQTAMAWVILIAVLPVIGFVVFWLFGRTSVGRRRRAQHEAFEHAIRQAVLQATAGEAPADDVRRDERLDDLSEDVRSLARLNSRLTGLPLTFGNRVELVEDYHACIRAMTREIAAAERYVHVQFYITAWDEATGPFFDELVGATERGVSVRLLFDHVGSRRLPEHRRLVRRLADTRIQWARMLPVRPLHGQFRRPDLRNHRKILVVDGHVAYTGSQNLIEPGYGKRGNRRRGRKWVELMARVEGPVVGSLDAVFDADWVAETGDSLRELLLESSSAPEHAPPADADATVQVVPSGPGYTVENNLRLFNSMLYSARRRLSIASPYFVPDDSLMYAVTTAAQRGVDVELFVSATADQFMVGHAQRSYYETLLAAGVRIWLYPAPLILHAKHFSVDGRIAVIGSSNMDMRSFALNFEVVMMFTGAEPLRRLAEVEDHYRALSAELVLDEWRRRPRPQAWLDNLMRLTATLQ